MDIKKVATQDLTASAKKSPDVVKDKSARIDTRDYVQKGEGKSFFQSVKDFVKNNITGTDKSMGTDKASEVTGKEDWGGDYGSVKTAALACTAVGGATGAVVGYVTTETDPANLPESSIELEWHEPVMNERYIGEVPRNFYEPVDNSSKSAGKEFATAWKMLKQGFQQELDPTRPVYADAPVKADPEGILMTQRHQVFTGRGEVEVDWETKGIEEPYLAGFNDNPKTDTHKVVVGTTPNGEPVTQEVVDGVMHKFTPDIRYQEVGEYQTPDVEFKTPDPWERAGMGLAIGSLIGLGVGTVVGLIHKVLSK